MTEYALTFKGTLMLATDLWKKNHACGPCGPEEYPQGFVEGTSRAIEAILTHATGRRVYAGWIESIIAMEPVGPCGWAPAIAYIADQKTDPEIVSGRDCDGVLTSGTRNGFDHL